MNQVYTLLPLQVPQPSTLPLTKPHPHVILWLSQNVVNWKFFARYLEIKDNDVDRIVIESANSVREQCYAMLKQWRRQTESNMCNYRTLGTALSQDSENCDLYRQFVEKIFEYEPVGENNTTSSHNALS